MLGTNIGKVEEKGRFLQAAGIGARLAVHFRSLLPEAAVRLQQSKAVLDRRRSHVLDRLAVSCPHGRCWHARVAGRRTRGDHHQPQRGGRR
jgi:hypothetical protein